MSDVITLKEYEEAELSKARAEARRGLFVHAFFATLGVLFHYVMSKRVDQITEARQRKIEARASEVRVA
ncbi:MAG: hypothetical protein ACXVQY_12050 [Actinomycetota bacterium]